MKLKISDKRKRTYIRVISELRTEVENTFGYRIDRYFMPSDIPLCYLSDEQRERLYRIREDLTDEFKKLKKPLNELLEQLNFPSFPETEDPPYIIVKIKREQLVKITTALTSLRKLHSTLCGYLKEYLDESREEQERIFAQIQEINRRTQFVKVIVENPFDVSMDDELATTPLNHIQAYGDIVREIDFVVDKFSSKLKKALDVNKKKKKK